MNRRRADFLIFGGIATVMVAYYFFVTMNVGRYDRILDSAIFMGLSFGLVLPFLSTRLLLINSSITGLLFMLAMSFGLQDWEAHSVYRNVVDGLAGDIGLQFGVAMVLALSGTVPLAYHFRRQKEFRERVRTIFEHNR